jgi:hypothetical protein
MPCPSHPPWLDHSNYTWRRVHVLKFHINVTPKRRLNSTSLHCFTFQTIAFFIKGNCDRVVQI